LSGGDDAEGNAMSDTGKIDDLCDISFRKGWDARQPEIDRLRAVLQKIAADGKNCTDYCRRTAALAVQQSSSGSK
jgi:hypothetical protein